jgi:hypothetical protein
MNHPARDVRDAVVNVADAVSMSQNCHDRDCTCSHRLYCDARVVDQEHFYVNAAPHDSGYPVESTRDHALKRINTWGHGEEATTLG